ncbi:MAG: thioredoxin family protein, partial [Candidatus Aenigmarchaeota archaeon]|nr:thioredoxin family protein [Candidatus Aenigmarchaeota archaeon]
MTDTKKTKSDNLVKYLLIVVVAISLFNMATIMGIDNTITNANTEQKEQLRPADIEIITITSNECDDCNTFVNTMMDEIKTKNVNILTEKTMSLADASDIIQKNNIENIPAIIITGELTKNKDVQTILETTGNISDDTYVYSSQKPPYQNIKTNEVVGLVSATVIKDSDCEECQDLDMLIDNLKANGVNINKKIVLEYTDDAAK